MAAMQAVRTLARVSYFTDWATGLGYFVFETPDRTVYEPARGTLVPVPSRAGCLHRLIGL